MLGRKRLSIRHPLPVGVDAGLLEFALNSAFQATGSARQSMIVSFMRKGTLDLPLMVALNTVWPLYGLMLVQPIMECVTALVAVVLWARLRGRFQTEQLGIGSQTYELIEA